MKLYGQEPFYKPISPLTPTASSLGKFGDVPVSYYTGLPNISVPIYDIVIKGFHIPISLSYHAEGVRVEEVPSLVGMGWTLNAGGVINREKRGNPDEYLFNFESNNNFVTSINQYLNIFDNPVATGDQINSAVSHLFKNNLSNPTNTDYDSERDVFSLITPNLYQKYIIDTFGKAYCMPAVPLKIEPKQLIYLANYGSPYPMFSGWNVTDQNGIQYSFGKGSDGILNADIYDARNNCDGSNDAPDIISSWYLEKIKLPSGESITFQYDSISYCYPTSYQESRRYPDPVSAKAGDTYIFNTVNSNAVHYSKAMRIKTIIFPEGKVVFSAGVGRSDLNGDRVLDNIAIYSKNNSGYTKEKTFQLNYNNSVYRLALLSVQEIGKNGDTKPPYTFDYFGDNNNYGLPPLNSPDQDIWGFYNMTSNQSLLPGYIFRDNDGKFYGSITGANRCINTTACQYGTLKNITYPTGGYTEFEYENNRAKGYVSGGSIDPLYMLNNLNAASPTVEKSVHVNVENTNGYNSALSDIFRVNTSDNNGISVKVNANTFNPGCTITSPMNGANGSFYECFSIDVLEVDANGSVLSTYRSRIYFGENSNLTFYPGHFYKLKVTWNDISQIGNYARVWFYYMDSQDSAPSILNPETGITKKYIDKSVYADAYNDKSNATYTTNPFIINNAHGVTATVSAHVLGKSGNSSNFENDGFDVYIISEKTPNTNIWETGQKITYSGQTSNLSFNTRYKLQVVWNTSTPTYGDVGVTMQYTDYESVPQLTNYDRVVGGLRVSKITDFEKSNGQKKVRRFLYEMNQKDDSETGSSGILMNIPTFFSYYTDYQLSASGVLTLLPNALHITSFASNPQIFTQGAIAGYRKVTEQFGENGEGGYTNYYYTSALDYPDDLIERSYYYPHPHTTSYDWRRGLLTKQIHYKNEGASVTKVASISNNYNINTNVNSDYQKTFGNVSIWRGAPNFFHMPGTSSKPMIVVDGMIIQRPDQISNWIISYSGASNYYKTIIESFPLIKQEVHTYASGQDIVKTTNLEQSPFCLTTAKSTTTNSNGKQVTLVEKTVGDIVTTTSSANDPAAQNFKNMLVVQHNLMAPVEQYKIQTDANGNRTIIEGTVMTYNQQLLPQTLYKLEISSPLTESQYTACQIDASGNFIKSSYYQPNIYFDMYDAFNNLLQLHYRSNMYTTYLWGPDGQHMIAKIVGADFTTVNTVLTQSQINSSYFDDNALATLLQTLRTDSRTKNALVTTYTYKPLVGITSMTDPRGVTTNYSYDTLNRLFLARNDDKNIVGRYSYGYQNAPDNGQVGYTAPVATVTPGATTYNYGTTGTATLSGVSGGSGSYTYSWSLKNSTGTVLVSNSNTTSTTFSFTCSQTGTLTIQCGITDNTTGISTTVSTSISSIGYTAPVATVTPGATTYNYGSTGTATLGSVSGGSGSYTYNWYLKNSASTVLASNLNTTSTSFSFTCSQGGPLTIQCVIIDNITGLSSTPSTTITSGAVTVSGSFTTMSGYTYPYTSLSKTGSGVTFGLVFLPTSSPMSVGYDYYIASVSAGFQPSGFRYISYDTGGRTWNITINSNGSVYCKIVSGTSLPVGSVVAFGSLTYNL